MTIKAVPRLTPLEIQRKQQKAIQQARSWLDPDQLAEALFYRSRHDLKRAVVELLATSFEVRMARATIKNLNYAELAADIQDDAAVAFEALVECFGLETVSRLARTLDGGGDDDGGDGEPIATNRAA